VISELRRARPSSFIIADLKILDTGNLEARMAADASADAVVVSGLAPVQTLEKAITEARKTGIYSVMDMLNVPDPVKLIKSLAVKPDIVELHRAIDAEREDHAWGDIPALKKAAGGKLLVATAGGIRVPVVKAAVKAGADIIVVGRAITASRDVRHAAEEFLEELAREEIDQFRVMTDF
jgi:bifunctional enzyme Fae/Hps